MARKEKKTISQNTRTKKDWFSNKNYKEGLFAVISCFLVVILAIGVNVLVGKLPNSAIRLDTTQIGLNSLSEETETLVSSLDTDVELYLIAEHGTESVTTVNLLRNVEDLSKHVTFETIDPAIYPNFLKDYIEEKRVSNNSILVVSEERSKFIDVGDYDSSTYYVGEDYVVSAINFVVARELPVLYCITGHEEQPLSEAMVSSINLNGYQVESLKLEEAGGIPEDAELVMMLSPKSDLTEKEADLLLEYLEDGGSFYLVTGADAPSQENLMRVMDNYGVAAVSGYICEDESGNHINNLPAYIVPDVIINTETNDILSGVDYVTLPMAHGIVEKESYRESVKVYGFLQTSDYAYAKQNLSSSMESGREPGDIEGPFHVGVAITERVNDATTKILWISSAIFMDSEVDEAVGGENSRLFMNGLDWLDDDNVSSLHAKVVSTQSLKIKASEVKLWGAVVAGVIPLSFLLVGVLMWVRRKTR